MKVLIATGLYPPEMGGPATHTRMLEDRLPSCGVEVEILPFRIVRTYPPVIRHLVYAVKLFFRARKTHLLFAQDPFSCGLPVFLAARVARKPFIVRIPGDYAWEQARERFAVKDSVEEFQRKRYRFSIEVLRAVEQFVVRHAEVTVTPSKFIGRIVERWQPRQLHVIPNGVDVPKSTILPATIPERPFIVTASRLIYGKGFECLIDLMEEMPGWRLVIVGSGPLEGQLKERAARSPASDRILFTGTQSREEMFGWYAAATVFVLNTEFETFSFQVIEALAAGVPTIATAVGGIPEIVKSGVEGLLVTPNDKKALKEGIESVIANPAVWEQRKQAGLQRVQELSSAKCVASFAKLFKEVCSR